MVRIGSRGVDVAQALPDGESGQGLVEYSLLAGLLSIAAVGVISLIGPLLPGLYQGALNAL